MRKKTRAAPQAVAAARKTGAELRALRRALDITQLELAKRARCSQPSVARVERGELVARCLLQQVAAALLKAEAEAERW